MASERDVRPGFLLKLGAFGALSVLLWGCSPEKEAPAVVPAPKPIADQKSEAGVTIGLSAEAKEVPFEVPHLPAKIVLVSGDPEGAVLQIHGPNQRNYPLTFNPSDGDLANGVLKVAGSYTVSAASLPNPLTIRVVYDKSGSNAPGSNAK